MRLKIILSFFSMSCLANMAWGQLPCDLKKILHNPKAPVYYSPDSSKYFVNLQDTNGIFQIYVGNKGDTTPVCISTAYTTGNCCGLFRSWDKRNKLQVQWHPSGKYLICGVEKEYYNELLYTPYSLLLGWLQSGLWMDIWAVTPNGMNWYNLANTIHGMTGPAFTPNGTKCVWSEAQDSANLAVDKFGKWKLRLANFNTTTPAFSNIADITPAGCHWNEPGNFSPNGTSLLLTADIGLTNAEGQDQFILDITNGNIVNLNNTPKVWDEHGVFSPDGTKILFMSSYPYKADTNSYHTLTIKTEFMLMNTDGSGLEQLTHFGVPGYIETSPGIAATGFWGRGDSTIYAQSLIFPNYDNWIIKFHGDCGNTATSVDELTSSNSFHISPNPFSSQATLQTDNFFEDATLSVYNSFGQIVKQLDNLSGQTIMLYRGNLPSGLYFIRLTEGSKTLATDKLVITDN